MAAVEEEDDVEIVEPQGQCHTPVARAEGPELEPQAEQRVPDGEGMVGSPKKRRRSNAAPAKPEKATPENLAAVFGLMGKTRADVSGAMVDLGECRMVTGGRQVLTVALADATNVVSLSIWSPLTEKLASMLQKKWDETPEGQWVRLEWKDVEVVAVAESPMKITKLQTIKQSTVKVGAVVQVKVQPADSVVIKRFEHLGKPEQSVALEGWLYDLKEVRWSKKDQAMRSCLLGGADGFSVRIMLFAHHAQEVYAERTKVSIHYAKSQEGLVLEGEDDGGSAGYYWCYEDAVIIELKPEVMPFQREVKEV